MASTADPTRRRAALAILALTIACWCAALSIAVSLPSFYGVDEPAHLGYVATLLEGKLPTIDEPLPTGQFHVLDVLKARYDKRGGGPNGRDVVWVANHPPLYYVVAAPFAKVGQKVFGPKGALLGMRFVSATFIALGTLAVAALAARLVPGRPLVAVSAAGLYATTAQIAHVGALAYSDAAEVMMWPIGLAAAVEVVRRRPERCTLRFSSVVATIAALTALTRASLLPVVATIAVAWVVAGVLAHREGQSARRALEGLAASVLAPLAFAGWWYVRNEHLYGSSTADKYLMNRFHRVPPTGTLQHFLNVRFWVHVARDIWGQIRDGAGLANATSIVGIVALVALLVGVWEFARHRRPLHLPRIDLRTADVRPFVAWAAAVCCSLALVAGVISFVKVGGNLHPRYFLPLVCVAVVAVGTGLASPREPWLPVAAIVVFAGIEAVMLWRMIRLLPHYHAGILLSPLDGAHAASVALWVIYVLAIAVALALSARRTGPVTAQSEVIRPAGGTELATAQPRPPRRSHS